MAAGNFISTRHSETHFELKLQNFAVKSNSENRFTFVQKHSEYTVKKQKKIDKIGKNLSFMEFIMNISRKSAARNQISLRSFFS
jgi:hypothetical protein